MRSNGTCNKSRRALITAGNSWLDVLRSRRLDARSEAVTRLRMRRVNLCDASHAQENDARRVLRATLAIQRPRADLNARNAKTGVVESQRASISVVCRLDVGELGVST